MKNRDVVDDMNPDCVPRHGVVHKEILPEIAENDFDISDSTPLASSSYVPPISQEVRSGSSFVTDLLLQNHITGITASPFISSIETLQKSVSLHGIIVYGLTYDEYKHILLRHIFGGGCVQGPDNNDRTACRLFAHGFNSPQEMTRFAFDVMSSAKSNQRSTDELLFLFHALELESTFKPRELRRQIVRKLKTHSKNFMSPITACQSLKLTGSSFEKLDRPTLLSIASSHHIQVDKFTSTKEELKTAIISHFAHGDCCRSVNEQQNIGCVTGCVETVDSILNNSRDFKNLNTCNTQTIRNQFIYDWLVQQHKNLSRNPLIRLLEILEIEFDTHDDLRSLRSHLKRFMATMSRQIRVDQREDNNIEFERKLTHLHSEWPTMVSQSLKDKLVKLFREQTSSAFLAMVTCASCSESCLASESIKVNAKHINLDVLKRPDCRTTTYSEDTVVDPMWLDSEVVAPIFPMPITATPDIIVDPKGVSSDEHGELILTLCKTCRSSISSKKTPPLALANHMVLGDIPDELKELTVVEEAMIAKCRAKCWVIQLKEENSGLSLPNSQRGVKGHIIVYPQRPSAIATILPPPLEEVSTPICVIFVGSSPPTNEWLQKKAKPLAIRREKVRNALMWLKRHNPHYKDVLIDESILNSLPHEYTLPVHVEHVLPSDERDALTARYDGTVIENATSQENQNNPTAGDSETESKADIPFQNVVIADVDGNAPSNELRAAAIRHIKKKGGGYVEIPHDPTPVNEFLNPDLFPMIYPTLFPYGIGGFENTQRTTRVSMKRHVKHLFNLSDRRFQEHYSFLFTVFNILQRRQILLHSSLKVKRQKFESVAHSFAHVSPEAVHRVTERVARGDWTSSNSSEERQVLKLMKEVNVVTSNVQGSAASRVAMRNELRGLMMDKGLPSFYITINPADVYNPLVKFLAGSNIDIDNLLSDDVPNYWEQSVLIAKNPAVAAKFFDTYMKAFISTILAYDPAHKNLDGGILGVVKAYYGCVEAQGRGSLHCHMLIWVEGALNPNEIKERVLSKDEGAQTFSKRLLAFLDDTISTCLPPDDPDFHLPIPSSQYHPCSVRGLNIDDMKKMDAEGLKTARNKDMHNVVKHCQTHSHSATCYKYWKGPPDPKECRFDLDEKNICPKSYFDPETGELHLQCLDGMVNNFNATIIEAIRCNMDIKFIGSGPSAKAVLYYITDYISKSQLKSHVAFAALELAVNKLDSLNDTEDDLTVRAKKLLRKCAYAMISHQELSAQQVCSYLMEYGDHYTSHEFKKLYWTAFEKFINDEDPSPECYDSGHSQEQSVSHSDNMEQAEHVETDNQDMTEDLKIDSFDDVDESYVADETSNENVTIKVDRAGELIACTSQIVDYQQRSQVLSDLSLWDAIAQTEKVIKTRNRKPRNTDDDTEPEVDIYENEPQADDDVDSEEGDINKSETHLGSAKELFTSHSRIRPRLDYLPDHPDYMSHSLKICVPNKRFVPVPIGPSIPRRDNEAIKERYCRLMLIFFKPWRHAQDLRSENETWSDAFENFIESCLPETTKIIENMQLLHECKDSRDDHFANRRSGIRNRANQILNGQSCSRSEDDFGRDNDSEDLILEHLVSIQNSRSVASIQAQQDVLTCLKHAETAGLFPARGAVDVDRTLAVNDNLNEEIFEQQPALEELWKKKYDDRKQEWKKKAQVVPVQTTNTNTSSNLVDSAQTCNIRDGSAFRSAAINSVQRPTICQNIPATDADREVDIDEIVQEFTLNREQARAFRIVALHSLEEKPKPLRMYLGGPGGTGKSRVINALKAFFDRRNQSRRFRLSSYTGVAAKNISGMTLHAALCLNQRKSKSSSDKTRRDLISMWEGVDYLFIDEVSMIGCRLMLKISEALNDAKENQSPFGGMNIVFAGDFSQLPPVGDTRLFSQINTHDIKTRQGQENVFGKLLWLSVKTVVILDKVMRQSGEKNNKFIDLLQRLRQGRCTDEDYDLLNKRLLKNVNVANLNKNTSWQKAPIIVSNNDVKDALNERATLDFATQANREVHWYYSTDVHARKIVSEPSLTDHLQKMNSGKTNQRLGAIPLVIGMPVMICQNFDVEGGVVNGCIGTLEKIRYTVDCEGRCHAISCVVHAPSTSVPNLPNLPPHHVVALQDTVDMRFVHPYSQKTCTIKRTQLPVVPAFAMTAHKSQGQTMDQAIVDLQSCRGTESPYVMLSRVTSLEGLAILRPFDKRKIQSRQSEDSRREAKRLEYLRLHTVVQCGDEDESAAARVILSKSRYRDQINMEIDHIETPTITSESAKTLQLLQNSNYYLTSAPTLPKMSTEDVIMADDSSGISLNSSLTLSDLLSLRGTP